MQFLANYRHYNHDNYDIPGVLNYFTKSNFTPFKNFGYFNRSFSFGKMNGKILMICLPEVLEFSLFLYG